jgi:hypothetical protein
MPWAKVNDAHAVREVVYDPYLRVGASCDSDWLKTNRDRTDVFQSVLVNVEYLKPVVRRVDGK